MRPNPNPNPSKTTTPAWARTSRTMESRKTPRSTCAPHRRSMAACQNEPRAISSSWLCALVHMLATTMQRPCARARTKGLRPLEPRVRLCVLNPRHRPEPPRNACAGCGQQGRGRCPRLVLGHACGSRCARGVCTPRAGAAFACRVQQSPALPARAAAPAARQHRCEAAAARLEAPAVFPVLRLRAAPVERPLGGHVHQHRHGDRRAQHHRHQQDGRHIRLRARQQRGQPDLQHLGLGL